MFVTEFDVFEIYYPDFAPFDTGEFDPWEGRE